MAYIDTHAHLYASEFEEDINEVINRCSQLRIEKLLLPNIDLESLPLMNKLAEKYPTICFPMLGLHPCSVKENYRKELNLMRAELEKESDRYIAIGEIGTDLYWDQSFKKEMEEAFREQINWAIEFRKPIVIHSRDSLDWNIQIISEYKKQNSALRGIFHCFNGSIEQGKAIAEMDFLMGVGGVITYKNAGLDKVFAEIPLEHLVLETDSPYLAPVPHRGKRNSSEYIPIIAQKLADAKDMDLRTIEEQSTQNALGLFGLA